MPEQKSPESTVIVLKSINPVEVNGSHLEYPALHDEIEAQQHTVAERWQAFEEATPGSNEERSIAGNLAAYYLLKTSVKLNEDGKDKDVWADRFTNASQELYDIEPDVSSWRALHTSELANLEEKAQTGNIWAAQLLGLYESMGLRDDAEQEANQEVLPNTEWQEYILQKYEDVFNLVADGRTYGPSELQELFENAFMVMATRETDEGWLDWHADLVDKDMVSVVGAEQTVRIGKNRTEGDAVKTRQLLAHELLVHSLRAQRAKANGHKELVRGLSGYLDAEEGLGIVNEVTIDGKIPNKAADRYHDIGLALGLHGVQLTRLQLFEIARLRNLAYEEAIEPEIAHSRALAHVNRIFRGGPAQEVPNTRQAIFVKDMAYFTGYHKVCQFINEQLESGIPTERLFDWMMQGKFDPTNPQHTKDLYKNLSS